MEGSGGHTKECKVRTTTSANPLLAAVPPFRASSGLILGKPAASTPAIVASPPPSSAYRFSSAGGYNALSYKAVLSSPSLNCFPPRSLLPSLSNPISRRISVQPSWPSSRADHLLKRLNDTERVFPFALDGRHSSRIHEWSLVGRRIPRLRARSSTFFSDR